MSRDDTIEMEALNLLRVVGLLRPQSGSISWRRSLRHDVMLVADDDSARTTWLIKRCGEPIGDDVITLRWENAFHRWITPRPLSDALAAHDASSEALLPALGGLIATLHAVSAGEGADVFPLLSAPVQTFGRLSPETVAASGQAFVELATLMQARPKLNRHLRDLRSSWRSSALVHGDLKSDNVLIVKGPQGPELLLIDWECAGIGDPAWDCGSAIGSMCFAWVRTLASGSDAAELRRHAGHILAGIDGFWSAYADARQADPAFRREAEASRTFRWAGFWLVQRVMAKLPLRPSLSAQDICALHIAGALLAEDLAGSGHGPDVSAAAGSRA